MSVHHSVPVSDCEEGAGRPRSHMSSSDGERDRDESSRLKQGAAMQMQVCLSACLSVSICVSLPPS